MKADRDLERRIAGLDPAASVTVPAHLARAIMQRATATDVRDAAGPLPQVEHSSRVTRGRGPVLAAAAAVAVLTAGTVAAVQGFTPGATGPASSAAAAPPVAPGWQRISSLGMEVDVPASWPMNPWDGCEPVPATAVYRGQRTVRGCGSDGAVVSSLTIEQAGAPPTTAAAAGDSVPAPSPTSAPVERTVGRGVRATVQEAAGPGGRTEIWVTVPERRVRAVITGTDRRLLERILATVNVVNVDSAGCSVDQPPAPDWDRPADGPGVSVGAPVAAAVCAYHGGVLSASATLRGQAVRTLAAAVDRAPAGTVARPPTGTCTLDEEDPAPVWLHMRAPDGSRTSARLRYAGCGIRYLATPDGVSKATDAILSAALRPLVTGYSTDGDLPPG